MKFFIKWGVLAAIIPNIYFLITTNDINVANVMTIMAAMGTLTFAVLSVLQRMEYKLDNILKKLEDANGKRKSTAI